MVIRYSSLNKDSVETGGKMFGVYFGFPGGSDGKETVRNAEDLGWEDPRRRARQPAPVFLPGESPWAEDPGGLQFVGSQRVRYDWPTKYGTAQVAHKLQKCIS